MRAFPSISAASFKPCAGPAGGPICWKRRPQARCASRSRRVPPKRCVGYCVAVINSRGHAKIESMYVDESFRRRGVGSSLVKRMLNWFGRKKVKSASVNVAVGNESAFKFYEQWGFYPRVTSLVRKK